MDVNLDPPSDKDYIAAIDKIERNIIASAKRTYATSGTILFDYEIRSSTSIKGWHELSIVYRGSLEQLTDLVSNIGG